MAAITPKGATIDDLYRVEGQAELIDGRVVRLPLHGHRIARIIGEVASCLHDHAEQTGRGEAHTSTLGYAIPRLPSGRESFCADDSCYVGPPPSNPMGFIEGPPTFAVEVRSENDYGPAADRQVAAKQGDYFAAGTLVVWDVDPVGERVDVYRRDDPTRPTTYGPGQDAEAEPAVPGWRIAVDRVFGRA
ncbi:MAG: Uma2 family endonuclease [Planctomycetia bacterium]|nr:Uma2 family endonuclease [Planctomycetia bacterium]